MHIHILGICGTFMGGIAAIAQQAGHKVTGCDANVYPPMSDQLRGLSIELIEGFDAKQADLDPDIFVIGNAMTRGNPLVEEILNRGSPYTSGPDWLWCNIVKQRWVLAVAGTHGKTTTSAILAWILEYAGLNPGFLIGGVPGNFGVSARLTDSSFFVVEADEYDSAFFDKRSKFVHYRPRTAILNNLEYDHADIFPNVEAIETQFHHLVRTIPGNGLIVANIEDAHIAKVISQGCWTTVEWFGSSLKKAGWGVSTVDNSSGFIVSLNAELQGTATWSLTGTHNRMNALAAIVAARHAGVPVKVSLEALEKFGGVKRRMEVRGVANGITVYDDFAHHPTAIAATLAGLRAKIGGHGDTNARIIAVLEPRTNTMKQGAMRDALPAALAEANFTFCYANNLGWDAGVALQPMSSRAAVFSDMEGMLEAMVPMLRPTDHVLIMSNGAFGGIHQKLLNRLEEVHG